MMMKLLWQRVITNNDVIAFTVTCHLSTVGIHEDTECIPVWLVTYTVML